MKIKYSFILLIDVIWYILQFVLVEINAVR